jgi:hypothetical protein
MIIESRPEHAPCAVAVKREPKGLPRSGDRVRIEKGPFAGADAVLLQNGSRLIVSLELSKRELSKGSIAVEFDSTWVKLLV